MLKKRLDHCCETLQFRHTSIIAEAVGAQKTVNIGAVVAALGQGPREKPVANAAVIAAECLLIADPLVSCVADCFRERKIEELPEF